MRLYLNFIFSALLIFLLIMCKHEPSISPTTNNNTPNVDTTTGTDDTNCSPDSVYFENEILPIFITSCAFSGCHDAASAQKGVILTDYNNIIKEIVPNNLNESDIYEVITETDPDKRMPLGGPALASNKIELISKWIQQGAPNNNCEACDTITVSFQNDIFPLIQNNCQATGCHGSTGRNPTMSSYQNIKDNAELIQLRAAQQKTMPPGGPLPDCNIQQLNKWIRDGAQDN